MRWLGFLWVAERQDRSTYTFRSSPHICRRLTFSRNPRSVMVWLRLRVQIATDGDVVVSSGPGEFQRLRCIKTYSPDQCRSRRRPRMYLTPLSLLPSIGMIERSVERCLRGGQKKGKALQQRWHSRHSWECGFVMYRIYRMDERPNLSPPNSFINDLGLLTDQSHANPDGSITRRYFGPVQSHVPPRQLRSITRRVIPSRALSHEAEACR